MLDFLRQQGSLTERKTKLYGVAVCRRIWTELKDNRSQRAVEIAEQDADGLVSRDELRAAADDAKWVIWKLDTAVDSVPWSYTQYEAAHAAWERCNIVGPGHRDLLAASVIAFQEGGRSESENPDAGEDVERAEQAIQAALLRDIVGNPFRTTPTLNAPLLTPDILSFAMTIYDERQFARLPELAALLEAAGLDDAMLLGHLKSGDQRQRNLLQVCSRFGADQRRRGYVGST